MISAPRTPAQTWLLAAAMAYGALAPSDVTAQRDTVARAGAAQLRQHQRQAEVAASAGGRAAPPWLDALARIGTRTATDCLAAPSTMRDPCDRFLGQALQRVYGHPDFSDVGGAPLTTAAVADSLAGGVWPGWRLLATLEGATDAPALRAALFAVSAHLRSGEPVVVMHRPDSARAQLALVLPDRPTATSLTLRGASTPRVACVIRGRARPIVDALLSYCFTRSQRPLLLYARAASRTTGRDADGLPSGNPGP